jgi:hypothetical protein
MMSATPPGAGNTGNGCGTAVGRQAHRPAIKAGGKGAVKEVLVE